MAENENVLQPEVEPKAEKPKKPKKSNGGIKEFFRKQTVNLKRHPQRIPMVFLAAALVMYLCTLTVFAKCVYMYGTLTTWSSLAVFVCTLFSMLVLVSYMRITPAHKKPSIAMMVVTYLFIALLIFMDVVYIVEVNNIIAEHGAGSVYPGTDSTSKAISVAHIVLEAIAAVLLATMPLWKKLLMKINTKKEVESASAGMTAIDLEDAD